MIAEGHPPAQVARYTQAQLRLHFRQAERRRARAQADLAEAINAALGKGVSDFVRQRRNL